MYFLTQKLCKRCLDVIHILFKKEKFYKCSLIKKEKMIDMINKNILNELKPHYKTDSSDISPNYFIAIGNVKQENEGCYDEKITFELYQINKPLSEVLTSDEYLKKDLTITNVIEVEDDKVYPKFVGFEKNEMISKNNISTPKTIYPHSHFIEVIETTLSKTIEIDFNHIYKEQPSVFINIDKDYASLYRKYSLNYKKNKNNNYYGVKIFFESLKTKVSYPTVKITIIGDKVVEEENDSNTN